MEAGGGSYQSHAGLSLAKGETAEVIVGSAGEVNPQSLDVEVETRRSVAGDGRIIQDR